MKTRPLQTVKSDPQREAFYAAEAEFTPPRQFIAELTRNQAETLVDKVRKLYKLPPVSVHRGPPSRQFGAYHEAFERKDGTVYRGRIVVARNSKSFTPHGLLHELAHCVNDCYTPWEPAHGPTFAGVAAWLYDHFRLIPQDAFRLILRRYKVRAISHAEAAPKRILLTRAKKDE